MKLIVLILAHTGSTFVNVTVNARDLRTPLHLACAIGNLAISQLLIWVSKREYEESSSILVIDPKFTVISSIKRASMGNIILNCSI